MGWRQGLIFRLLHRFGDPADSATQREDEEYRQFLRAQDIACDPPGEPERQELLRLLEEEIASVREEFAYAEKANEERAAIERDACLAPEGETWRMMLRQEAALDRSIDRKVRILLRLRKEFDRPPGRSCWSGRWREDGEHRAGTREGHCPSRRAETWKIRNVESGMQDKGSF